MPRFKATPLPAGGKAWLFLVNMIGRAGFRTRMCGQWSEWRVVLIYSQGRLTAQGDSVSGSGVLDVCQCPNKSTRASDSQIWLPPTPRLLPTDFLSTGDWYDPRQLFSLGSTASPFHGSGLLWISLSLIYCVSTIWKGARSFTNWFPDFTSVPSLPGKGDCCVCQKWSQFPSHNQY